MGKENNSKEKIGEGFLHLERELLDMSCENQELSWMDLSDELCAVGRAITFVGRGGGALIKEAAGCSASYGFIEICDEIENRVNAVASALAKLNQPSMVPPGTAASLQPDKQKAA